MIPKRALFVVGTFLLAVLLYVDRICISAAKHGIPRAYESVEAMLDAEKPEFVDIATRPDTHEPLTCLAAQSGIHVICQKPMAPTMVECVAMCEVCEAAHMKRRGPPAEKRRSKPETTENQSITED